MSSSGTPDSTGAQVHPLRPRKPAGRVIVGVDGSASSVDALHWAVEEALLRHAEVHAVIAWSVQGGFGDVWMVSPDIDYAADARKAMDETLDHALGAHPDVAVHRHVVEGHPATALLRLAAPEDLIVLGSHGHGGFVGALIGSVSQRVASHAECPVVIVRRPKDTASRA
jgi:nucleotide-binding universal stress UspA family protein